jgi:hypothetical protein
MVIRYKKTVFAKPKVLGDKTVHIVSYADKVLRHIAVAKLDKVSRSGECNLAENSNQNEIDRL